MVSLEESFKLYSTNNLLNTDQLSICLKSNGKVLSSDEISILIQKSTNDYGTNLLTLEQYTNISQVADTMVYRDTQLIAALAVFDNGQKRGLIDKESFKHTLMTLGDCLSKEEIETILKDAGVSKTNSNAIAQKSILKLVQQTPV